jgi:uncharacterized lipoprotein YehR (DUF1307 family)
MKMLRKLIALFFAGFLVLGLSGCEKEEGPAEKAGESIDKAADSIGEQYEETKDAVEEKLDE